MGLMTSMVLLLKGFNVNLIANVFPENKSLFNGKIEHSASQIAGGYIIALHFEKNKIVDNDRMIKETWELIKKLEKNKK